MHFTAMQGILNGSHSRLQGYPSLSHCPCAIAMFSFSLVPRHTELFLMVFVHTFLPLSGRFHPSPFFIFQTGPSHLLSLLSCLGGIHCSLSANSQHNVLSFILAFIVLCGFPSVHLCG